MSQSKSLTLSSAILYGGLIAGILDAADGVIAYYLAQAFNPIQVLQFIASGFYGPAAFQKGLFGALIGVIAHFFIAFVVAAIYVGASRLISVLGSRPFLWGTAYGAAVFLAMNFIVLPQTAVVRSAFSLPLFLNGIIGHSLFVGLPIALAAHRTKTEWKLVSQLA
jgi:uncharacterized membrane protein YagU involved in acid resistance